MKTTYIYYPGLAIAIVLLILNLIFNANINVIWIFLSLLLGWVSVVDNWKKDKSSIVVFFPLIRKLIKKWYID